MNLIKWFIWFFIFFLNYAIFQANLTIGIVFLLTQLLIYSRIKGGMFGMKFRTTRIQTNRLQKESSNATLLVLELMKMEQKYNSQSRSIPEIPYQSAEHEQLRKEFER